MGGNDLLNGGKGDDTMVGGQGADTFVLRKGPDVDRIVDFEDGIDKLRLLGGSTLARCEECAAAGMRWAIR
jgi:serralysin